MNLAEKARAIANDRNQKIQTAIQEIVNYFKEYLNSNKFEQLIEKEISNPTTQRDGYGFIVLKTDYEYAKDQETKEKKVIATINLEGKKWIRPDNFFETHGISFDEIRIEVCRQLHAITKDKLREMGFTAERYNPTDELGVCTYFWIRFTW